MKIPNFPELRILAILGIITLGWHLLSIFGSFLGMFTGIFLLLVLAWILAFILEPLVNKISKFGLNRIWSAVLTYIILAIVFTVLVVAVLPTTVSQISQLASLLPGYLPENFLLTPKVTDFLATTATNSVFLASQVAGALTNILLAFILSFYFLISKADVSKFILSVIPEQYKDDYLFLEKTLTQTFGAFLQIQVVLGLVLGLITLVTLVVLQIDFAISTSIFAAFLAMIPVVGAVIFLVPVILACLTVSLQKMIIAVVVIVLAAQLIFNVLSPKLLGNALKIHPVIVLLSFLIGYRLAGLWGAIFAIPVTSAFAIIGQELLKYWQEEADK